MIVDNRWNLTNTPANYVLDHNELVRHKGLGGAGEKAIDTALDKLTKDAEVGGKQSPR